MKRIILLSSLILFLSTTLSLSARNDIKIDNEDITVHTNNNKMSFSSQDDNFSIYIAGMQFKFGTNGKNNSQNDGKNTTNEYWQKNDYNKCNTKAQIGSEIELGISILHNTDYSLYQSSTLGEFMELDQAKSIHINIPLANMYFSLNKNKSINLSTGAQLVCDNYTFNNNVSITADEYGILQPYELNLRNFKKSKLTTTSLRIPLMLNLYMGKIYVAGGVYGELLLNAHTKVKSPKDKERIKQVNQLRYGVQAKIGVKNVYLYGEMGQTALFKTNKGPETFPYSIGIGINL